MLGDGCGEDYHAEEDYGDAGGDGEAGGGGEDVRFGGAQLAEEEAEAGYGEAYAHQAEAGADPGEEGSLGGEVDTGVLLRGHGGIVGDDVEDAARGAARMLG